MGGQEFLPISLMKVLIIAHGRAPSQIGKVAFILSGWLLNLAAGVPLKVFRIADIGGLAGLG